MVAFIARAVMARAFLRKVPAMSIRFHKPAQSGFTLIEMLVVLSIMAVVAGVGVQALNGVTNSVKDDLARTEMNEIASAIQRFHADTGYWPKQGPFANTTNPASFAQLRIKPTNTSGEILPFDTASGTGWHGPYMRELDAVTVSVGDVNENGTGDPATGTDVTVSGLGDPFSAAAIDETYFVWSDVTGEELRLGRPYLYFIADNATYNSGAASGVYGCHVPCLLSLGPNGRYESETESGGLGGDDIVLNIAGHKS